MSTCVICNQETNNLDLATISGGKLYHKECYNLFSAEKKKGGKTSTMHSTNSTDTQQPLKQETKRCPYCAEEILMEAKKCKHCNEFLSKKEKKNQATINLAKTTTILLWVLIVIIVLPITLLFLGTCGLGFISSNF